MKEARGNLEYERESREYGASKKNISTDYNKK